MGVEIERKFLVIGQEWRLATKGTLYRQGYIRTQGRQTVRARIAGETGYLTIKGPTTGVSRLEFEYEIPVADAQQLLDQLCDRPLVEKLRYRVNHDGIVWEIDEFMGENHGLILAEVELDAPDQAISLPSWIGAEVSGDQRYFNSNLATTPFCHWPKRG